jgi:cytochrome c553
VKRRIAIALGALLLVAAVGGFLVAASGVIPIAASSGHWAATEWLLQFAKRRSVATQTIGSEELDLAPNWLVVKGAGHYETGCRPCHGSPELDPPTVAQAMLPPPPSLAPRISEWDPQELFYIVKHGIKFTGMPAWPSQTRDDEVTAMVAFLLELPNLDADAYDLLVHGESVPRIDVAPMRDLVESMRSTEALVTSCARCHGFDGCGREVAAFPRLAGQRREYVLGALQAYAADQRHSGIMRPIAVGLDADQMRVLADHFARIPACAPHDASASAIERGHEIAARGAPDDRVPSCTDCHGPDVDERNPAAPVLEGQYPEYLVLQLELFVSGTRGGSTHAHLMDEVAPRMSPEQMLDVAQYYGSLTPASPP